MIPMAPVVKWNTPKETLDIEFEDHKEEYPNSFYDYGDGTVPGEPEEYLPRRRVRDRAPPSLPTLGLPLLTALRVDPLLWGGVDASNQNISGSNNGTPTPSSCHDEKAVELTAPSGGDITNGQRDGNEAVVNAADENRGEVPHRTELVVPTGAKEYDTDTGSGIRLPPRQPIPRTSLALTTDDWIEGLKKEKGKTARRGYVFDKSKAL